MAQMDKAERRQVLLRAARDVFATKGYHDAKVDDITAQAKVAKGTFYLYFTDKRAVLSELVDLLFQRIGAAILKVEPSSDIEGQIKHNIRAIVAVLLDDPALTRILFSFAAGLDPAFVETIRAFYDGVKMLLEASLAEGQSLGIVAEGDAKVFATFTIGALKEMIFETVTAASPRPREEIVDALFRFLQAGYLRIVPAAEIARTPAPPPAEPSRTPRPPAVRKRK